MRILYVTTIGTTMRFFENYIKTLMENENEIQIACNNQAQDIPEFYLKNNIKQHSLSCSRNPFSVGNISAVKQIKKIVENEYFDIVHCHTPIAAACCRIACRKARKKGTRVIYTAHGFHFYKGAPLKNWLIFYPIEKICSYFTDVLITINKEDYALAKSKFKAKRIEYVPGVGMDLEKFGKIAVDKKEKRKELGIPETSILLLSVGELNKNKNHETVLRAIADMNVYYIIAGKGDLQEHLQHIIDELNMTNRVKLLGYRNDVWELCEAADAFIFPSFREGLSVSVMEAMASGLPVVCSRIRGNTDLIDENGGILFDPFNVNECKAAVSDLLLSNMQQMGKHNLEKIKNFSLKSVNEQMFDIIRGGVLSPPSADKKTAKA